MIKSALQAKISWWLDRHFCHKSYLITPPKYKFLKYGDKCVVCVECVCRPIPNRRLVWQKLTVMQTVVEVTALCHLTWRRKIYQSICRLEMNLHFESRFYKLLAFRQSMLTSSASSSKDSHMSVFYMIYNLRGTVHMKAVSKMIKHYAMKTCAGVEV